MDFLTEIEYAGMFSRIKRLSDELIYSTRDYYKTAGLDIEPNWHLIFLLLERKGGLSITEISENLKLSHPACIKIITKMKDKDFLISKRDKSDSRKQILELSAKALKGLPHFKKHWEACIKTTKDLIDECPEFLQNIEKIEYALSKENYKSRTHSHYQNS